MSAFHKVLGYMVDFMDELGRGAFGTVYKGLGADNEKVAMKKVSKRDKRKASTEAVKFHFLKEKIAHLNIVQVHSVKTLKDSMWIIMEYCDLGDLNQIYQSESPLLQNADTKYEFMKQIGDGIAFLHGENIVHRDIKPGNILLKTSYDNKVIVKLGDFGLSKMLDPDSLTSTMSSNVGTLSFKAPEFWDTKSDEKVRYHRNVDVYAAGLTFAAMLQGKPGQYLVPRAEGSMQSSEAVMPIGLAAFTRMTNRQSDIKVVEIKTTDDRRIVHIKQLILEMTRVSSETRLSSQEVQKRLHILLKDEEPVAGSLKSSSSAGKKHQIQNRGNVTTHQPIRHQTKGRPQPISRYGSKNNPPSPPEFDDLPGNNPPSPPEFDDLLGNYPPSSPEFDDLIGNYPPSPPEFDDLIGNYPPSPPEFDDLLGNYPPSPPEFDDLIGNYPPSPPEFDLGGYNYDEVDDLTF